MATMHAGKCATWVAGALMTLSASGLFGALPANAQDKGWEARVHAANELLKGEDARLICADTKDTTIRDEEYMLACATFYHAYLSTDPYTKVQFPTLLKQIKDDLLEHQNGSLPYEQLLKKLDVSMQRIKGAILQDNRMTPELGAVATGVSNIIREAAQPGAKPGIRYKDVMLSR
ncbi:MAG: hypothetical protein EBQ96_01620 [Proteobacteria bacterium]|nr:hypothetical protein [Pseudomonadota bacterium]